jgi:hypothetical protein
MVEGDEVLRGLQMLRLNLRGGEKRNNRAVFIHAAGEIKPVVRARPAGLPLALREGKRVPPDAFFTPMQHGVSSALNDFMSKPMSGRLRAPWIMAMDDFKYTLSFDSILLREWLNALSATAGKSSKPASVPGLFWYRLHTARLDRPLNNQEREEKKQIELCKYVIHYADGQTTELPVLGEIDIDHFQQREPKAIPGSRSAPWIWSMAKIGIVACRRCWRWRQHWRNKQHMIVWTLIF